MKKALSLFLALVLTIGIFCGMPFTKIEANAVEGSDLFTIRTSGFENGSITYTLYLNAGVGLSGTVIYAKFDTSLLAIDTENSGAYMTWNSDGDEFENVAVMYVSGIVDGHNDLFSVGYISSNLSADYTAGSSEKPFLTFAFSSVVEESSETFVEFYCNEFYSVSVPENKIPKGSDVLIASVSSTPVHSYGDWVVEKQETCSDYGFLRKTCSVCGDMITKYVAPIGHNYSSKWTIDVPATCQSNGSKSHHCTRCDDKEDVTVIKPLPHKFSDWKIIKKPTYTSLGQKVSTCDVCKTTEYAVIPKLICAAPKLKKVTNTTNGIKITWSKVTGAERYVVLRKTGSGSWKKIAENVKTTSYTDETAKAGKIYKYTVRAKSDGGLSKYNTTGLTIKRLKTPTLKSVSSVKAGVTFKWNKVTGAGGYLVYRKTGNGSWKQIATVKGNAKITYLDKTAKKGTTYKYTVKAYYGSYVSAYNTKGLKIKDKY